VVNKGGQTDGSVSHDRANRFFGVLEFRFLRGPFFAELIVTDAELRLRPRYISTFHEVAVAKEDVLRVTIGGA